MANYRVEKWNNVYAPNPKTLINQLESEEYSVHQWIDKPGTFYGFHDHYSAQTHWIISGVMEFFVEGKSYILKSGDRDFLPAGIFHSSQVVGEEELVYLIGIKNRYWEKDFI